VKALLQRVTGATVHVDGALVGQTGPGLMILVCAMQGDDAARPAALARKVAAARIFRDEAGKMNRSVRDIGGSALVVSQFTLAADTSRGNRPGFSAAAEPGLGEVLFLAFVGALRAEGVPCETGRFGADMQVALTNDGPVTIMIEV
jgi:D-aminoacyl-tRNA deacylase